MMGDIGMLKPKEYANQTGIVLYDPWPSVLFTTVGVVLIEQLDYRYAITH